MSDGPHHDASGGESAAADPSAPSNDDVDDVPRISCSRCGESWELAFELEELHAGNQAVEQFALDHERHTGHFPDDVTPWLVECRNCPDGDRYLAERPARRWAATHARHTGHAVSLEPPAADAERDVITSE